MTNAKNLFHRFWGLVAGRGPGSEGVNRRIFAAAAIIGLMTLAVKAGSVGKELVVAAYFGTGDALDAFLIAFILPQFAVNIIAGSFGSALIPTLVHVRQRDGREAYWRLFLQALLGGLALLIAVALVLAGGFPWIAGRLASGFGPDKLALTRSLFYVLLPTVVLTGLAQICASFLNARRRFALAALAPGLTPLCMAAALAVGYQRLGVFALAWGAVVGAGLEFLLLGGLIWRRKPGLLAGVLTVSPDLRAAAGQYAPMAAGAFLMSGTLVVDQSMAAMLRSGDVAALNYGNRVTAFIMTLGATALGTAVLPYYSQMVAAADLEGLRRTLNRYLQLVLAATVPLTLLIFAFSQPLAAMLFQRGAFTADDAALVGRVQAAYVLQMPFYLANILMVRLISALKRNQVLFRMAVISFVFNIGFNVLFMRFLGVVGIAVSTSAVYAVMSLYMWLYTRRAVRPDAP
jgi:putative peptidoglycan lipid II flippase